MKTCKFCKVEIPEGQGDLCQSCIDEGIALERDGSEFVLFLLVIIISGIILGAFWGMIKIFFIFRDWLIESKLDTSTEFILTALVFVLFFFTLGRIWISERRGE